MKWGQRARITVNASGIGALSGDSAGAEAEWVGAGGRHGDSRAEAGGANRTRIVARKLCIPRASGPGRSFVKSQVPNHSEPNGENAARGLRKSRKGTQRAETDGGRRLAARMAAPQAGRNLLGHGRSRGAGAPLLWWRAMRRVTASRVSPTKSDQNENSTEQ